MVERCGVGAGLGRVLLAVGVLLPWSVTGGEVSAVSLADSEPVKCRGVVCEASVSTVISSAVS